jgi:hypothetical protein
MKLWMRDTKEVWSYGDMDLWSYGAMELRRYGAMELRSYGAMELRSYGAMELRSYGVYKEVGLLVFSTVVRLPGHLSTQLPLGHRLHAVAAVHEIGVKHLVVVVILGT